MTIHCGNVSGLSIDNGPGNPLEIVTKWLGIASSISAALYGFVVAVLVWIEFLFVKNLLLVIGLWIGVTMAFSAVTTVGNGLNIRNLERFYKKFFGYQMTLFRFMVELWNYLIQIISSFRGIFRI